MAYLLFDWFGFNQTSKADTNCCEAKQLNPNNINRRSAVYPLVSVLWVEPDFQPIIDRTQNEIINK